jgi:hypothetical protein
MHRGALDDSRLRTPARRPAVVGLHPAVLGLYARRRWASNNADTASGIQRCSAEGGENTPLTSDSGRVVVAGLQNTNRRQ